MTTRVDWNDVLDRALFDAVTTLTARGYNRLENPTGAPAQSAVEFWQAVSVAVAMLVPKDHCVPSAGGCRKRWWTVLDRMTDPNYQPRVVVEAGMVAELRKYDDGWMRTAAACLENQEDQIKELQDELAAYEAYCDEIKAVHDNVRAWFHIAKEKMTDSIAAIAQIDLARIAGGKK